MRLHMPDVLRRTKQPDHQKAPEKSSRAPKTESPNGTPVSADMIATADKANTVDPPQKRSLLEILARKKRADQQIDAKVDGVKEVLGSKPKHNKRKEAKIKNEIKQESISNEQEFREDVDRLKNSNDPIERASGYDLEINIVRDGHEKLQIEIARGESRLSRGEVSSDDIGKFESSLETKRQEFSEVDAKLTKLQEERGGMVDKDGKEIPDQVKEAAEKMADEILKENSKLDADEVKKMAEEDPLTLITGELSGIPEEVRQTLYKESKKSTTKELDWSMKKKVVLGGGLLAALLMYTAMKSAAKQSRQGQGGMG